MMNQIRIALLIGFVLAPIPGWADTPPEKFELILLDALQRLRENQSPERPYGGKGQPQAGWVPGQVVQERLI